MARIVLSVYLARDPLAGIVLWNLQWASGLKALGHDVWLVEKANYPQAFFQPRENTTSDDAAYGYLAAEAALASAGLPGRLCVVEFGGRRHGLTEREVAEVFRSADVLLDIGNHGAWLAEARHCTRVLVDGEPGYTQMKMQSRIESGEALPHYDRYYTNGANIGRPASSAPTAGCAWRHVFNPVIASMRTHDRPPAGAPFTTVMNWQAHSPLEFRGTLYGQKDVEFERFMDLPGRVKVPMELAVAGVRTPRERLQANGWKLADPRAATATIEAYLEYIRASAGEFSVCKNVFVATRSGWFSDRSALYLSRGRPVVMQDTGFSEHLPTGAGLFAVSSVEEAAEAIERIASDYDAHARAALRIAREHLDTAVVLRRLLREIGC